ncbi:MAG: tRNA pseudouridine(55) synthase TruB [Actinomycetota bacterium]|nr:tRNA pseudouridine(55) synthase TruB [Actinomycetota bacterium]
MTRRGGRGENRPLDGVLVVDKPAGIGSTDVVRVVRRAAGQRRVGHTGTLDPDATGVLVVCLGRATRLVRFLQVGRKTYLAQMVLGMETTTQDASGQVVAERSAAHVDEHGLCEALASFIGEIEQVPPMVSAVKVGGQRLYDLARRGEDVERPPRVVTVHEIVLDSFIAGERAQVTFLVTCSSGTYVRTLAHDIGRALGCGATLTELRRLANGPFTVEDAHPLDEVTVRGEDGTLEAVLLSPREAVRGLPTFEATPEQALAVAVGRTLPALGVAGPFAVVTGERLLAVYSDQVGGAQPEAVLVQPSDLGGAVG